MLENPPELVDNLTLAAERVENATVDRPILLYATATALRAAAKGNCNLTILSLPVMNRGAFAFAHSPPAPPLASMFNKLTLSYQEFGNFIEQQEKKVQNNMHPFLQLH